MSRINKRKHVLREMWENDFAAPAEGEIIAEVIHNRGSNLHEVKTADGEVFLVSMPNKFRKLMWIRHSMYVLITRIAEGNKVKGEIVRVINDAMIQDYASRNIWPAAFSNALSKSNAYETDWETNRYMMPPSESESSDDEASDDSNDDSSEQRRGQEKSDDNEESDCTESEDEESDSEEESECSEQDSDCESGSEEDECENESAKDNHRPEPENNLTKDNYKLYTQKSTCRTYPL